MADEYQGEPQTTDAHVSDAPKGHEQSDVTLRPLLQVAGILVAITVIVHVALWVAMRSFERDERRADPPPSPVADARPAPPEPRLQPTIEAHPTLPFEDVIAMRRSDREVLESYGWVDRQRGIARIPIDRAIEQVVEESRRAAPTTRGANR
jgi:hypothetical protein